MRIPRLTLVLTGLLCLASWSAAQNNPVAPAGEMFQLVFNTGGSEPVAVGNVPVVVADASGNIVIETVAGPDGVCALTMAEPGQYWVYAGGLVSPVEVVNAPTGEQVVVDTFVVSAPESVLTSDAVIAATQTTFEQIQGTSAFYVYSSALRTVVPAAVTWTTVGTVAAAALVAGGVPLYYFLEKENDEGSDNNRTVSAFRP